MMTYVVIVKGYRELRIATPSLTRAAFLAGLYLSDGCWRSVEIVSRPDEFSLAAVPDP